jgi:hypothetical protein
MEDPSVCIKTKAKEALVRITESTHKMIAFAQKNPGFPGTAYYTSYIDAYIAAKTIQATAPELDVWMTTASMYLISPGLTPVWFVNAWIRPPWAVIAS